MTLDFGVGPVPFDSGFYIDGHTEARITEPYGSVTIYSNGEGGFFSIGAKGDTQ